MKEESIIKQEVFENISKDKIELLNVDVIETALKKELEDTVSVSDLKFIDRKWCISDLKHNIKTELLMSDDIVKEETITKKEVFDNISEDKFELLNSDIKENTTLKEEIKDIIFISDFKFVDRKWCFSDIEGQQKTELSISANVVKEGTTTRRELFDNISKDEIKYNVQSNATNLLKLGDIIKEETITKKEVFDNICKEEIKHNVNNNETSGLITFSCTRSKQFKFKDTSSVSDIELINRKSSFSEIEINKKIERLKSDGIINEKTITEKEVFDNISRDETEHNGNGTSDLINSGCTTSKQFKDTNSVSDRKWHFSDVEYNRETELLRSDGIVKEETLIKKEIFNNIYKDEIKHNVSSNATRDLISFTRTKGKSKQFKCKLCPNIYRTKVHLNNHIKVHSKKKIYKCEFCERSFTSKGNYSAHVKVHTKEKSHKCFKCGKAFAFKCRLNHHLLGHVQAEERPFKCETCKQRFTNKKILKRHETIHESSYECHICGKRFRQISNLFVRHIKTHTAKEPYDCQVCQKRFIRKQHLNDHMRIHTGEKPFQCEICGQRFTKKMGLKNHVRIHTEKTSYECQMCQKIFTAKHHLDRHMRFHTREKPYKCQVCPKTFSEKSNLVRHNMRIHTREKPYECQMCLERFPEKYSLDQHLRIHAEEKPYECKICLQRFSQTISLKKHTLLHA